VSLVLIQRCATCAVHAYSVPDGVPFAQVAHAPLRRPTPSLHFCRGRSTTSIVQSTCRLAIGLLPLSALCEPSGSLGGSCDLQKAAECLVQTRCQARLCNGGLLHVYFEDRRSRPCFPKRNTNLELDKKAISTKLKLLG
jgi:hypothetical protein